MTFAELLRLPLLEEMLPGGLRYGANYLVEFEPHSLWHEASLTLCAQALRQGKRADYHTFTRPPSDILRELTNFDLDIDHLMENDLFRIWDSYTVQTGIGSATSVGKTAPIEHAEVRSVKLSDWDKSTIEEVKGETPEIEKRRLHIDDDTSVLLQFNNEKTMAEHFRKLTVPWARKYELSLIHSVAIGTNSDRFYKHFESFCDGIIDFTCREENDRLVQQMRLRVMRGVAHDSGWRRLQLLSNGEVKVEAGSPSATASPILHSRQLVGEKEAGQVAASVLDKSDSIDLSRYSVIGTCMRYDNDARNMLKDLRHKITSAFETIPSGKHENYMIWASPGGGKTFFVREIASEIRSIAKYSETNLAETDEQEFRRFLNENEKADNGARLCFIDEVDSQEHQSWPYEALLSTLEKQQDKAKDAHVFILAGSRGASLNEMKTTIASRHKGTDLLSRIPFGNEYSIPAMSPGDKMLVALSVIEKAGKQSGKHVVEVEKFGLYYIMTGPELSDARRLREFALRSIERVPRGEDRLKYDMMFDLGDPTNKEFWLRGAA